MKLCAHDQTIVDNVNAGKFVVDWFHIDLSPELAIEVTRDAVIVDGIRCSTTPVGAQAVADLLGGCLLTPLLSDLLWNRATVVLPPRTQAVLDPYPGKHPCRDCKRPTSSPWARCVECGEKFASLAIGADIAGRAGIIAPIGKQWVLCKGVFRHVGRSQPYGWQIKSGGYPGATSGVHVLQPYIFDNEHPDNHVPPHNLDQLDYAEPIRLWRAVGVPTGEVLRDPELAKLVSHEGSLPSDRHPGC